MTVKTIARTSGIIAIVASLSGCQDIWINSIYPLGGQIPGGRGTMDVVFSNQTPYRAIFTFGTFDRLDETSVPGYGQFVVDPEQDETPFNRGLGADTVTERGTFLINCGRVFSLGGEELISRIQAEDAEPLNGAPAVDAAFRTGIYFTSAPLDDPDPNGVDSFNIRIDPVESLIGVDYSCDSLLIYTFTVDPNNANNVLVDLQVIENTEED